MDRDDLLTEVVRNLETSGGDVTFTPTLEEHYRRSIVEGRRRAMAISSGIGLAVLIAFVLHGWLFTSRGEIPPLRNPWLLCMAAIAVAIVSGLVVVRRTRSHRVVDAAIVATLCAGAVLACLSLRLDATENAWIGLFCYTLMPVACTSLVSLHFRQAFFATAFAVVLFLILLATAADVPTRVGFPATLMLVSTSVMTLWANYRTDRDRRSNFLYLTRERLLSDLSRRQNLMLREINARDPLTGIANRRAFESRFADLIAEHAADGGALAVMMIDIDHFKRFNDHYGHIAGDDCLRLIARTLASQLRGRADLVARIGGEEFVAVAPGLDVETVAGVAERVRRAVEQLAIAHDGLGSDRVVTVSIGCAAAAATDVAPLRALPAAADRALYRAKGRGRNCWQVARESDGSDPVAGGSAVQTENPA